MELLVGPMREIAIVGEPADPRTRSLLEVVQRRFDPLAVIAWGTPDGVPLLDDRPLVDGAPAAYVCQGFVCQAPVSTADELARDLGSVSAAPQN
jgi:uncharacterized protein YyaL (SSP411 family)